MKYSSKDLKTMARMQLTGKFGIFIGAFILYDLISSFGSMIINFASGFSSLSLLTMNTTPLDTVFFSKMGLYYVFLLILSLILSVLGLGFNKMFLDGSRGYPVRFSDLFYGFRHHPDRVILMQLLLVLINLACFLPGLLLLIPLFLGYHPAVFGILSVILSVAAIVPIIYFYLSFSQSMYLMADYDDLGPVQALKESHHLMVGNKGRLFYIQLSFIGLYLLSVLSCGLGMLWVFPYTSMTCANFYRNLGDEI